MPPFRASFTKVVTTDTTSTSLVVGGATPVATTGTGGIIAGPIAGTLITGTSVAVTAGLATSGGTLSTHGLVMPTGVPALVTNALYNNGASTLYWNGSPVVTGAGTVPAGANMDVQFNNAGAFGADTGIFTYNSGTDTLGVNNIRSQIATALTVASTGTAGGSSGGVGTNASFAASDGTVGSGAGYVAGGAVAITAGHAAGQTTGSANGGAVTITAGNAAGEVGQTPSGGAVNIVGGTGVNGLNSPAGVVNITGGANGNPAGHVNITGGAATQTSSSGGTVTIAGGSCSGGSSMGAGSVVIKTGDVQFGSGTLTLTTGAYPSDYGTPGTIITIKPSTPTISDGIGANPGAGVLVEGGPGQPHLNSPGNSTGGPGGTLDLKSGVGGDATANGNTRTGGAGGVLSVTAGAGGSATGSSGTRNGGNGGALVLSSGVAGTGASANGTVGTITFNVGATEAARFNASANLGVGTGATVSARIHSLSTTEQLRLGFDASNYLSTTVASNGGTTFAVTGGGAVAFSQAVTGSAGFIGNLTGNVTGNTSGSAATVTAASQPAITSLGTLTTLTVAGPTLLTGTISPTQLVGNTNDWAPTGLSTANVIRVDVSMNINLTGLVAQSDGRVIALYNKSAFVVSLIHDATSTAANRFYCPGGIDYPLSAFGTTLVRYDGTDQRWTVFI